MIPAYIIDELNKRDQVTDDCSLSIRIEAPEPLPAPDRRPSVEPLDPRGVVEIDFRV